MSNPHEQKTTAPQAGAAPGAANLAVVQPTQASPAQAPQRDTNHGRGGLYRRVNGVRKRIEGTEAAPTQPVKEKE